MSKIDIEITNIKLVCSYKYKGSELTNDLCGICNSHLMIPTNNYKNNHNLNCDIVECKCKHLFHSDCMNKYIHEGNNVCPVDMSPLEIDHLLDNNRTYKKIVFNEMDVIDKPILSYNPKR